MSIHVSSKGVSYYGTLGTNRQTTTVSSKCLVRSEAAVDEKWPCIRKADIRYVESFSIIQGVRRWFTSRPKNCSLTRKFSCSRSKVESVTVYLQWQPRKDDGSSGVWLSQGVWKLVTIHKIWRYYQYTTQIEIHVLCILREWSQG